MEWTEAQIEDGWWRWRAEARRKQIYEYHVDEWVKPLLQARPQERWLKNMRQAALLSAREMARRLCIQQPAYQKWEQREESGTITLQELKRCAQAMNCDLIYGFRPKDGKLPSRAVFDQIVPHLRWKQTYNLFAQAVDKFACPKFRAAQGWPRNRGDIMPLE